MSAIADVYSLVKMATTEHQTPRFLVEWYGAQAPAQSIGETADRLNEHAASMSIRGQQVRLLTAMAVPADDYAFGVFAAESAELVAQVCRDACAPAARISSAIGWVQIPGSLTGPAGPSSVPDLP